MFLDAQSYLRSLATKQQEEEPVAAAVVEEPMEGVEEEEEETVKVGDRMIPISQVSSEDEAQMTPDEYQVIVWEKG